MRLKLSALFLSTALAAALVGGGVMMTLPAATVAVAQVPSEVDVDALLKFLPASEVTASYDSKSYDPITGVTTVKGLKIVDAKDATRGGATIEQLELRGVDMEAFAHVFDFAKYSPTRDESFKQLVGDVTIHNLTVSQGGSDGVTLEQLSFAGLQMKQLPVTQAEAAQTPGQAGEMKMAGSALDSIIAGKLELTNLVAKNKDSTFKIAHFSFDGLDRGKWGAILVEALEVANAGSSGSEHVTIASLKNDGIDLSKCVPWMIKAEMPPVTSEPLLYIGATSASGIDAEVDGGKISVASYSIDPVNFYWLVPAHVKAVVDDLVIVPPAADADELGELGIDKLNLDYGIELNFDGDGKTLKLAELRIEEPNLLDAKLSVDLTGIDLARLVDSATSTAAAAEIGLAFAQLYVKNNGIFEIVLDKAAKEQGTTPDALKQQALDQLGKMEGGMPGPDGQVKPLSDRLKAIIAAVKAFIQSPGTLTVKVQPASPITIATGMGAMFDPMSAADALGITVESTPK